jgi:hypothetical protein
MMKCRLLYRNDGGVSVIYPAPNSKKENETEKEWLDRVFKKSNPSNLLFKDIEQENLPSRKFRNQWVKSVDGVVPDLVKSKERCSI